MDDKKKLIIAISLFVVAIGLIAWYVGFGGTDPGTAVGGAENAKGAAGPSPNRYGLPPEEDR